MLRNIYIRTAEIATVSDLIPPEIFPLARSHAPVRNTPMRYLFHR
jgi:hypothetical protein